jgi:hypothetical protein
MLDRQREWERAIEPQSRPTAKELAMLETAGAAN